MRAMEEKVHSETCKVVKVLVISHCLLNTCKCLIIGLFASILKLTVFKYFPEEKQIKISQMAA